MDGFKNTTKIKYFKEGGCVTAEKMCSGGKMKNGGEVDADDIAQDKKIVKKAFSMHDKQEHEGEKTDLSKLRKGGRAKKETGTVKKFKCGGGVYGAKKTKEDIKNMDAAKECKPKKLANGGQLLQKPGMPAGTVGERCKGGKIKKMAGGGIADMIGGAATTLKNNILGTPEQNATAAARLEKIKAAKELEAAKAIAQKGAMTQAMAGRPAGAAPTPVDQAHASNIASNVSRLDPAQQAQFAQQQKAAVAPNVVNARAAAPTAPVGQPTPTNIGGPMPTQKRGGKVKGKC